jgi:hypothetical protein
MRKSACRTVLVALVAACALAALSVASASAALPEFRGIEGGKHPVAFTGKSGHVTINFVGGSVSCWSSSISGTIINPKEVAKVVVKFGEGTCAGYTFCVQGGKLGAWQTKELKGRIAYLSKSKEGNRIGLLLEPVAPPFAKCDRPLGVGVEQVVGSIIAEITPTNESTTSLSLGYQTSERHQRWTHFEGEETVHQLETIYRSGGAASPAGFEFKEDKLTTAWPVSVEG